MYMFIQLYAYVYIFFSMQGCGSDQQQNKRRNCSKENQAKNHSKWQTSNAFRLVDEITKSEKAEPTGNSHIVFCLKIQRKN